MADFNVIAKIQANVSDFQRGLASAKTSLESFQKQTGGTFERVGKTMQSVGKSLTKGVTLPLLAVGAYATKTGAEFESAMSKVSALSGATGKDLSTLEKAAREMGRTTRYGSTEAANALSYMSLAGWDTQQMVKGLKPVLNLASAGQMDLAQASDIVTDMMSMFGLEAEQAGRATDVFAVAQANSNTTVSQLGEALKKSGSAAAAAGQSLEDTSAILGVLANNGIKGSEAGTALNAMFRDLQAAAVDGKVAIGDTSVAVYDANGNMRSMVDIIADVEKATEGMTQEQKHNALASIFQQRSLKGMNTLLNSGSGELKKLQGELNNSTGAAQTMADEMDNNLKGSFMKLKSAMEDIGIAISQMTSGPLKAIVDWAKDLALKFQELSPRAQQLIVIFGAVAAAIGPLLWIFGAFVQKIPFILKGFKLLSLAFGAITSPVGVVIAGITAIVGVLIYLWKTNEQFREAVISTWTIIKAYAIQIWNGIKDGIQQAWEALITYLQPAIQAVADFVKDVWGGLVSWWQEHNEMFRQAATNVWNAIKAVVIVSMKAIQFVMQYVWPLIEMIVRLAWDGIKNVIQGAIDVITGIIQFFAALLTGSWTELWEAVKQILKGAVQFLWGLIELWIVGKILTAIKAFMVAVKTVFSTGWAFIKNIFSTVLSWIGGHVNTVFSAISAKISSVMGAIKGVISSILNAIKSIFSTVLNFIKSIVSTVFNAIRSNISSVLSAVRSTVSSILSSIKSTFSNIFNSLRGIVTRAFGNVRSAVSSGMRSALNAVRSFFGSFASAGRNIVQNIANGIRGAIGLVTNAISSVTQAVRNFLPFSPPKDKSSPLTDIHKNGIGTQIAAGIIRGQKEVDKAMNTLLSTPGDMAMAMDVGTSQSITHSLDESVNRPIKVHTKLNVGGYEFREFTQTITEQQQSQDRLERNY
ncbi:phage tail tape measure protein [Dolosigranulum pigrum]|uniref:Phage tail tape measure protein n=1 Tax=Dolosigranulum pigrum TaxID=29394 RepID=A0A328KRU5_9LACT|nr:phage tail tape measure protein [Dolosigranulum pigrum]RAN62242.1 phage tail tape measure protein [Dolosigranulum pigrum]